MKLAELLEKLQKEKQPIFVNGIKCRITDIGEEVITLETIKKETRWEGKGKDRKEKTVLVKETTYIPLAQIWSVSTGAKELPKSDEEKSIEEELEKALGV